MGERPAVAVWLLGLAAACATGNQGSNAPPGSPGAPSPTEVVAPTPSPLIAPKDCHPRGSTIRIEARSSNWVGPGGRLLGPGEACLAAPADEPFTITLRNDPGNEGLAPQNHNISIFTDSTLSERLFTGDLVFAGESFIYRLDPLPTGIYPFRCDVHPENMTGALVVE